MSGVKPHVIDCPCGNSAYYVDDIGRPGGFGMTTDEIAGATGFMLVVGKKTGRASWLCRECVDQARAKPRWIRVKDRLPPLESGQDHKRVMAWVSKPKGDERIAEGNPDGHVIVCDYHRSAGFVKDGHGPNINSPGPYERVTHWAELPKNPYERDEVCDGIRPEDHVAALFAASRIMLSPHEWTWTPEEQQAMAKFVQWASVIMPLPRRPMRCDCGCADIETQMDVGSDIDPGGEERQHLDKCRKCGLTRLWSQRFENFATPVSYWDKWSKNPPM